MSAALIKQNILFIVVESEQKGAIHFLLQEISSLRLWICCCKVIHMNSRASTMFFWYFGLIFNEWIISIVLLIGLSLEFKNYYLCWILLRIITWVDLILLWVDKKNIFLADLMLQKSMTSKERNTSKQFGSYFILILASTPD